jgi:hypothetical protein
MAQCAFCKADTELYDGEVPVCIKCSNARAAKRMPAEMERQIRTTLIQVLTEATVRANTASEAFSAVMSEIPSGIPHPDGVQRIHDVSRDLSAARKEMIRAHSRLNDFLVRAIIPEDLKRGGSR